MSKKKLCRNRAEEKSRRSRFGPEKVLFYSSRYTEKDESISLWTPKEPMWVGVLPHPKKIFWGSESKLRAY